MVPLKILFLFAALGCQTLADAANSTSNSTTPCPTTPDDNRDGTDPLCPSFQDLSTVIDVNTLAELVQAHYQCNSKFRKALCYYNTPRFQLVIQQLQQSEAYLTMLADLRLAGVDTGDIDNIVDIFSCLEQPAPQPNKTCDCKQLRGHTFVGDLLAAMPNRQVHEYTANARAMHNNFGLFADTITSPAFQTRMRTNLMKHDALRSLRLLRRYGWDLSEILGAAMTILTW